jgi:hypothetical protein
MTIELDPIASGYSTTKINTNFQKVEDEFNTNVLRRNGLAEGEANQMEVPLDMNSFDIMNVNNLDVQGFSIQNQSISGFVQTAEEAATAASLSATNAGVSETNAAASAGYAETQAVRAEVAADSSDAVVLRADLADAVDPAKGAALVGYKPARSGISRTAKAKLDDISTVADQASIQAAVNQFTAGTVTRGAVFIPVASDQTITDEILFDQKTVTLDGQNSSIKWEGDSTKSMIRVVNSARVKIANMVLLGDLDTPPIAAINFDAPSPAGTTGTNENCIVENVVIGRLYATDTLGGGTADASPYAKVQNGIIVGGVIDGNNDEFVFRNVQVHSASNACIDIKNTQSIWGLIDHMICNDSETGVRLGANITLRDLHCNRVRTADIEAIRNISVSSYNFSTENSKLPVWAKAGASVALTGGKWLLTASVAGNIVRSEAGGKMIMEGVEVFKLGAAAQTVYYRSGTVNTGKLQVKNCTIPDGSLRETWDVSATTSLGAAFDIQQGNFKWKKSELSTYIDLATDPASVAPALTVLTASGSATTPFGMFFNVSYSLPLQGMHLTTAYEQVGQVRSRLFNPTGSAIDLEAGRMRWMATEEHIVAKSEATLDAPSMANGAGSTVTMALPGAKLGDFVTFAVGASFINIVVAAYVNAPDTVAIRFHNATGGTNDPAPVPFYAGKLAEFGNYIRTAAYTPAAIVAGVTTTVTVPVPGAQLGGHCWVAYSADLKGLLCTAHVSAQDVVTIVASNYTGASVTLDPGHFRVMVAF